MGRIRSRLKRTAGLALAACLMLSAAPAPAVAQQALADYDNVRFQRYGVEDGLSQTTVRAMLQDDAGYVWLGTQEGLNRFDGYEFRVYRNDRSRADSLPGNHIKALERSRRGGFWVGTKAAGLARYLPERDAFARYAADGRPGSLADNSVWALRETADGTLWVSSGANALQWLPPGGQRFRSVAPEAAAKMGHVTAIQPLGERLLLGSDNGLWLLEMDGRLVGPWTDSTNRYAVNCIATSPDGHQVWVGTADDGLLRFDRNGQLLGQKGSADGLTGGEVLDLQFDRAGRLWVGTLQGLSRLDAPGAASEALPKIWRYGSGLTGLVPYSLIHTLMLDRDGLIWVGSWHNGFSIHVPQSEAFAELKIRKPGQFASGAAVYGLDVDPDGSLWLAVAGGLGLIHYDIAHDRMEQYRHRPGDPTSLPEREAADVLRDSHGRLWVATGEGLARKQGDGFVSYRHDPDDPGSLPEDALHSLYEDRSGTLWISTKNGFLAALCNGCSTFRSYSLGDGGGRAEVMFEDSHGNFWLGGIGTGLYRLDRDSGRLETFRSSPDQAGRLSHDSVTVIIEDSRGRLWVGTQGGGVNMMTLGADGMPTFTVYGLREGLAAQAVGGLVEDDRGRIWISTTVGISRLDPETGRIVNYGEAAGAQLIGYLVGSYARLPDGRIAFGGMQGVTVFDPAKVSSLPSPRDVALTELTVLRSGSAGDGSSTPVPIPGAGRGSSELVLPPDVDDIGIEFSALSYAAPDMLRYAYKMDGLGDNWVEVDATRRRVTYNNLEPGQYTFRAKARMPGGAWSEALALPIRLRPAWWETGWAKGGYVLLALLLLSGLGWEFFSRQAEREHTQHEIADSEQRLKLALWGTGDELWDWNISSGNLHRQNPLDSPDADSDELVENATQLRESVHPEDQSHFDQALIAHMNGADQSMEVSYRVRDPDGQWRWRLSRGRAVARDADGQPLRIVGTNSDITRLKENELELARINAELESRVQQRTLALNDSNEYLHRTIDELRQTQQQLVEAEKMAALGGLVAGVAHEINTPIGVSVTAASYLDQQARLLQAASGLASYAPASDAASLERFRAIAIDSSQLILRNLQRADRMIKSFKQVAVDQSSEESRRIELLSYLEEIMISLQPSLRRHAIQVDCPSGIVLETYPGAIYQIISNLAMNSLMHGFSDQRAGRIVISAGVEQDQVVLRYQDDGMGMDEPTRRRVFEPFFTTKRGSGGSGLGMHITWNLATQVLGGSIACQSAPGQGARFTLRIPMHEVADRDDQADRVDRADQV